VEIGKAILMALPWFPPFPACTRGHIKLRRLGVGLVGFLEIAWAEEDGPSPKRALSG